MSTTDSIATAHIVPDEAKQKLERALEHRPGREELVDRNILKNSTVAPALQDAQEQLKRSQLQDKLDHALQARPKPEDLVKKSILQADENPLAT